LLVEELVYIRTGQWCDTTLNVPSQTRDKNSGTKDGLYRKLEEVFEQFPLSHMNMTLRDTNLKLGTE